MTRGGWYDAARWSMLAGDRICKPKDIVKLDLSGYSAYEALEKITETTGYKIEVKGENEMEKRCGNCKYEAVNPNYEPCISCVLASNFEPKKERVDYRARYTRRTYTELETRYHLETLIKNVIFNDPATIVFWTDNTKTVVKCQEGDMYDPEKGLAMAICKKAMGNKGAYCNVFKKWLPEGETENRNIHAVIEFNGKSFLEGLHKGMCGNIGATLLGIDLSHAEIKKDTSPRDNLLVTAATRAVYMEADMDLVVLPTGVEGEAEFAKFIAERVDDYIRLDVQTPFDIFIEEALKIKYGVKKND